MIAEAQATPTTGRPSCFAARCMNTNNMAKKYAASENQKVAGLVALPTDPASCRRPAQAQHEPGPLMQGLQDARKGNKAKKSALPVPGLSIPCFAVAAFGHVLIRCAPHVYDAAAPRDVHMINYKRPRHFFTATVTATPALKKIHASINKTHTTLDIRRTVEYPSRTSAPPFSL